jgi:hypothetical protein
MAIPSSRALISRRRPPLPARSSTTAATWPPARGWMLLYCIKSANTYGANGYGTGGDGPRTGTAGGQGTGMLARAQVQASISTLLAKRRRRRPVQAHALLPGRCSRTHWTVFVRRALKPYPAVHLQAEDKRSRSDLQRKII